MISLPAKLQKLKPLWDAMSPRRRRQLFGLQILSLASAIGEVANLGALLPFLGLLAKPKEGLQGLGPLAAPLLALPDEQILLSLGLGFVIVVILSTSLRVLTISTQLRLSALISSDLGAHVFAVVLHRPFTWHLDHNSSDVLGNLTKDIDQASGTIQSVLTLLVNVMIVMLLGISLLALAPFVMLVIGLLLAGFYLLVFRFTRGSLRADGERLTINYRQSLQIAQEALAGIRDLLIDRSQRYFFSSYKSHNLGFRLAVASINTKGQLPRYLIEGFAVVIIVLLSLSLTLGGHGIQEQLPLLGTLILGSYRLLQPLQQCFSALSGVQANQASLLRLKPLLESRIVFVPPLKHPLPYQDSNGSAATPLLELRHLSFRYSSTGPWVLRHLDISIEKGERIAFVGSTGSGKSTTSDLILGLLQPTEGQLLVNGSDLHASPQTVQQWQQRVAHVPQSIYLCDSSFAANIAFGLSPDQIDHERVRLAASQARIAEMIENTPEGYFTRVGERGVRLSGGQRQRIGLARALYKQAELLVLDEATSALDNRTEAEVMEAIQSLDRKITMILIAHRLSTIQDCDRIILLEHGQISALGSYHDLVAGNDTFRRLAGERYDAQPNLLNPAFPN